MIGAGALAIWMDVDPAGESAFNEWYRGQHLGERLSVPGFLRGRRYQAVGDGPAYFTLYETAGAEVLSSAAYLARLDAPTDWTRRALPTIRRMIRNAYRPLVPPAGDGVERHVVTVRVQPHSGRGPHVRASLVQEAPAVAGGHPAATASTAYETETQATSVVTEERRLVGGEVLAATPYLVVCEVADPAAAPALAEWWRGWATRQAADVTVDLYRLLYGLAWLEP